jgi:D-alanyl-lipoteichoic acid acyltransferase DltB (MBOAT superfamily)
MHYLSPEFGIIFACFLWLYWWLGYNFGNKAQNILLLLASYVFYATFSITFALQLFIFSFIILMLARFANPGRKAPVVIGVFFAVANLGLFKYYNFFREDVLFWLAPLFNGASLPLLELILPVGISFYTFQGIAYLITVGRGERQPARFADGLLHLSFFPTLLAGPICRPVELLTQIEQSTTRTIRSVEIALLLVISALIKKIWFAAWLAEHYVDPVFANPSSYQAVDLICALFAYAWQLFFDFSGYTDIVTALALLLGFQLPMNFNQPYLAKNLSDFWQRWHVTLSRWIRDYVYISLGGNRGSFSRTQWNLLAAMTISGLWHGASLTFVVWGMWHGLGLIIQNCWKKFVRFSWPSVITQLFTFLFVCFGWLFFRSSDWESFSTYCEGFMRWQQVPQLNWLLFALAMTLFFIGANKADWMMEKGCRIFSKLRWWQQSLLFTLIVLTVLTLAPAGMPGFIYFGF